MKNENSSHQTERPRSRKLKIVTWILAVAAGLILLLFFGIPLYLSSSGGTNLLVGKINQSVDGQVAMDDFSMGWFGGVKLTNLTYNDSAGATSVKVGRIETQPKYVSLLGGKVKLGKTVVENPQIHLKVSESELAAADKKTSLEKPEKQAGPAPVFPIDQIDLKVIDGSATIELVNGTSQTVRFANIASNVQIAEAGKPSSVDVSMDVDDSTISAKGTLTPDKKGWTLKDGDFQVQVSKLQLASLKPLFALAAQPMDMAGELNADATIQFQDGAIQQLKADATITEFAQGSGVQRKTFDQPVTLSALVTGSGETVTIQNATVQSAFCTVDCSGTLESLTYEVAADLAETQRFAGQFVDLQDMALEGQLSAQGKVAMTDERIGVTGSGSARKLIIKKGQVQTPVTDVQMQFDGALNKAANQFQLASANLTAAPGTVNVSNLVLPLSEEAAKTVSLDARTQLDLAQVWPFVKVFDPNMTKDIEVAGMLNSTVAVTTEQNRIRLLTENTRINNLKITQPDTEPFQQEQVSLIGDIILDTENQIIDIRKLDMQAADGQSLIKVTKGTVEKKTSQNTTRLTGDLEAQYDLKALSAMASPFLPQGLSMEGKRTDAVHFESQYPADKPELLKQNLNASAKLGFDKARYQGLNFGPTEVNLNVKQGQAAIDIPEADVNGGKVQFAGSIDLTEEPMMLRLRQATRVVENVKIDDVVSAALLQYLNPVFARGTGVSGTANLSCSTLAIPLGGGGTPGDIHLVGAVGLTDVRLSSPLLGLIKGAMRTDGLDLFSIPATDFTVQDGLVRYDDMAMQFGSSFALHFGGTVGLDKSLAMTVKVPVSDRTVAVPLGGTLTNPKPDFSKLLLSNITEQIPIKDEKTKEAVEKGLEIFEGIFDKKKN